MSVVVGTAGHIDHGKTTLLRGLTGIDADRLPEERRRGMTIDVGYAHLGLADGSVVDFVDVPGHDRLVGNMLVGAGEIDAALVVIAVDDGPRAQTLEHLELLDALGLIDDGLRDEGRPGPGLERWVTVVEGAVPARARPSPARRSCSPPPRRVRDSRRSEPRSGKVVFGRVVPGLVTTGPPAPRDRPRVRRPGTRHRGHRKPSRGATGDGDGTLRLAAGRHRRPQVLREVQVRGATVDTADWAAVDRAAGRGCGGGMSCGAARVLTTDSGGGDDVPGARRDPARGAAGRRRADLRRATGGRHGGPAPPGYGAVLRRDPPRTPRRRRAARTASSPPSSAWMPWWRRRVAIGSCCADRRRRSLLRAVESLDPQPPAGAAWRRAAAADVGALARAASACRAGRGAACAPCGASGERPGCGGTPGRCRRRGCRDGPRAGAGCRGDGARRGRPSAAVPGTGAPLAGPQAAGLVASCDAEPPWRQGPRTMPLAPSWNRRLPRVGFARTGDLVHRPGRAVGPDARGPGGHGPASSAPWTCRHRPAFSPQLARPVARRTGFAALEAAGPNRPASTHDLAWAARAYREPGGGGRRMAAARPAHAGRAPRRDGDQPEVRDGAAGGPGTARILTRTPAGHVAGPRASRRGGAGAPLDSRGG